MPDVADLLASYDAQLRAHVPQRLPADLTLERDGPLLRWFVAEGGRGWVVYRDLDGLDGDDLEELIARQVRAYGDRGQSFEWKLHGHDRPDDLAERLRAAGFVPEDQETVVIAEVSEIARPPQLPDGVTLREVHERTDFDRIASMENEVWGEDRSWLATTLEAERAADPDGLAVVVAEAGTNVVCAGWARFPGGTEFVTLWGGATLPDWRGRGLYRAAVAYRANLAAGRGARYLEVDASSDSRPILERLGFTPVTTTTPFVWAPRT